MKSKVRIIAYLFSRDVEWSKRVKPDKRHALLTRTYESELTDQICRGLLHPDDGVIEVTPKVACYFLRGVGSEDGMHTYEIGGHLASYDGAYLSRLVSEGWALGTSEKTKLLGLEELLSHTP